MSDAVRDVVAQLVERAAADPLGIVPIVRAELTNPKRIRHVMAEDLRAMLAATGGVNNDDLQLKGWTQAQINEHAREAIQLARRRAGGDA